MKLKQYYFLPALTALLINGGVSYSAPLSNFLKLSTMTALSLVNTPFVESQLRGGFAEDLTKDEFDINHRYDLYSEDGPGDNSLAGNGKARALEDLAAYDIGCIYPDDMPDPFDARYRMVEMGSVVTTLQGRETPIVVRNAHATSYCNMNCLAAHDSSALNVFTEARPAIVAPTFGHNAFSITMCIAECYNVLYGPGNPLESLFDEWNLPVTGLEPEVISAATDPDPSTLVQLLVSRNFHPLMMGQLVALEIASYLSEDGWNSLGKWTYDDETGTAVPCTANCQPYADTTGYFPKNNPGSRRNYKTKGKDKYIVKGKDKRWQPLLEDDGSGYFSRQAHVTPHIGKTVESILQLNEEKCQAPNPRYDYREEALQVVEELRQTANSPERRSKIDFFDNKLAVRAAIQVAARQQLEDIHSFQDHLGFIHGLSSAEYDAILLSWREKVRHDLVRPTTVIQRWGSDELETYNGDRESTASATIMARDFQAYQRVMPHSEYPSASACLCSSYAEFADAFVASNYPDEGSLNQIKVGEGGLQVNCEGEFPFAPLVQYGCSDADQYTFESMADLSHQCGQSRLWGGMHFSKSVPAAEELCSGLGQASFDYVEGLQNGSDWNGKAYFNGDPRPVCGEGN